MAVHHIDISPHVAEVIRHLPPDVKRGVKAAMRGLSVNPAFGEPLKKDLEGLWKYRVKRFRIVSAIDGTRNVIRIIAVGHRRGIYEEVAQRMRRS